MFLNPLCSSAQISDLGNGDNNPRWSVGIGGGVLTGSIPTGGATTNVVSSRFKVNDAYYPSFRLNAGYHLTEFESIELNASAGSFSVFTDHEFWPELLFENQFFTGSLSTRFRLKRLFESLPDILDLYGVFGLGLMQSNHKVSPINTTGTTQMEIEIDQSTEYSLLFNFGAGFDISLSEKIALFLQYDYQTMNKDLIDRQLAGDILRNDFVQTTSNWSTFSTGIRIRFGKSGTARPHADRDFELTTVPSVDTDTELAETATDADRELDLDPEPVISRAIPDTIPEENVDTVTVDEPDNQTEPEPDPKPEADPESKETPAEADEEVNDILPEPEPIQELVLSESITDYGLYGHYQEVLTEGYTIIIHSFSNPDLAETAVADLLSDGFRAFVQSTVVNQINYYRVAIGQFESRNQARDAASGLPDPYRNNYFLSTIE